MVRTKRYGVPLSANDLRAVAKLIDRSEKLLWDKDGLFKLDDVPGGALTGEFRVPVLLPDSINDGTELSYIGHLIADDGWMGFLPLGEVES